MSMEGASNRRGRSAEPAMKKPCLKAPAGWKCTREGGHEGPCAAEPVFYVITATCEAGHAQEIKIDGKMGREWAVNQAGLLDGSSPMYIADPRKDPASDIGKCGICRAQLTCTVAP